MSHTSQCEEPRWIGSMAGPLDWAADAGYSYAMARTETLEWLRQRNRGLG
jgi:hypothetical protein